MSPGNSALAVFIVSVAISSVALWELGKKSVSTKSPSAKDGKITVGGKTFDVAEIIRTERVRYDVPGKQDETLLILNKKHGFRRVVVAEKPEIVEALYRAMKS